MKQKEFVRHWKPIELPQYGLVVYGYWLVEADDDKLLVRKSDGKVVIQYSLAVEFFDVEGKRIDHPYIEQPEDYDEILVSEYKKTHPEWIDPRDIPVPNE